MDTMLGQIKDIVQPRDVTLYDIIRIEVEKRWEKLNIPLHALAYVVIFGYRLGMFCNSPSQFIA